MLFIAYEVTSSFEAATIYGISTSCGFPSCYSGTFDFKGGERRNFTYSLRLNVKSMGAQATCDIHSLKFYILTKQLEWC